MRFLTSYPFIKRHVYPGLSTYSPLPPPLQGEGVGERSALRRLGRRWGDGERQALAPTDNGERAWLLAHARPVEDASKMLSGTDRNIIHRQQYVTYQQPGALARAARFDRR